MEGLAHCVEAQETSEVDGMGDVAFEAYRKGSAPVGEAWFDEAMVLNGIW